jgi:hypothetical protein
MPAMATMPILLTRTEIPLLPSINPCAAPGKKPPEWGGDPVSQELDRDRETFRLRQESSRLSSRVLY